MARTPSPAFFSLLAPHLLQQQRIAFHKLHAKLQRITKDHDKGIQKLRVCGQGHEQSALQSTARLKRRGSTAPQKCRLKNLLPQYVAASFGSSSWDLPNSCCRLTE